MQKMNDRLFAKKGGNLVTFSSGSLPAFIKKAHSGLLDGDFIRNYSFWINRTLSFHVCFKGGVPLDILSCLMDMVALSTFNDEQMGL